MPFTRPTLSTIVDRIEADMESRLTGNVSLFRRAVLRILARVFAGAIHLLYGYLQWISKQVMVDQAETDVLDRHGLIWGITRKAAAYSIGIVEFTGVNTTVIPEGTEVQTEEGIVFVTTAEGTIASGTALVPVQASEAGTSGNIVDNTSLALISPITDIDTDCTASGDFTNGQDAETDEEYRARILQRIQNPPMGGTAADFVSWALEVSGVSKAWTFASTPVPGKVTVVIKGTASTDTVDNYISERMPITADLVVEDTDDKTVDFEISIAPNNSDFRAAIIANLEQHFDEIAEPGEDLLISQLRNAISSAGVDDYEITKIEVDSVSKPIDDVAFSGFEYPIYGSTTFSTKT